ncbi:MICOS complex subunit MIC60, mitochondrial isoform X2 [Aristolochia californica]
MSSFLSSRKEFSVAAQRKVASQSAVPPEKPPSSGNSFSKLLLGGALVGVGAFAAAYQMGYIGWRPGKVEESSTGVKDLIVQVVPSRNGEPNSTIIDDIAKKGGVTSNQNFEDKESKTEGESQVQGVPEGRSTEESMPVKQDVFSNPPPGSMIQDDNAKESEISSEESHAVEKPENHSMYPVDAIEQKVVVGQEESGIQEELHHPNTSKDILKDPQNDEVEAPPSLSEAYFLVQENGETAGISLNGGATKVTSPISGEKEVLVVTEGDSKDAYHSKDGILVLDLIEAIHIAEKRQAELDARIYSEEKRMLKEKYEKELKDARARQLMYAEEAALLDEELNKERAKLASTVKLLQEKAEEKLRMELQRKDEEAELQLKKAQELAKAELSAAIAKQKSTQIEKLAEADMHINALCMAFFARSEEARQSHSVHKLALGVLALEDALSKGLPIQAEISALHSLLESLDKDSFLNLVLSSLPKETIKNGTDTSLQLNQKFDALKGVLRHYSLIPTGGGGILTHAVAHVASSIKMKENDESGDGIESVINKVESLVAEGKLAEAADALEKGVHGSEAQEIVGDWVKSARDRAIIEQALSVFQSYATSISLT